MITSEDGMHFDNFHDKKVIIPPIADPRIGHRTHARDPKVWRGTDAWYLVFGSSTGADRIAMLYQGEMIAIGTPDEIRNSTDSRVLEFINVSQIRKR